MAKEKNLSIKDLKLKTEIPKKKAPIWHEFYQGKYEGSLKCGVTSFEDFSIWYTPGVAEPCRRIADEPSLVFKYTNKWNNVAVISDGTRVLGLGDIGPKASLPVIEGKAVLFKYLGGVSAFPITLDTKDPDEIIEICLRIQPAFGGINLEDIAQPKCFYILDELRKKADIPVWHDDQQGTASVVMAGVINALKVVGKNLDDVIITQLGIGSAGTAVIRVLIKAGVPAGNVRVVDIVRGNPTILTSDMDLEKLFPYRGELLSKTNANMIKGSTKESLKDADVMISFTTPGPGVIEPEWISKMAKDSIVFPCANPIPEIWPWEAKKAGAKIVGTGRSDFENQVNNSLGFPGIFRGTLDVNATTITDEMAIAAAYAIAKTAEEKGLREDYIVPSMDEWELFINEAVAVGMKAIDQGIARAPKSEDELRERAKKLIGESRRQTEILMDKGWIKKPPEVKIN